MALKPVLRHEHKIDDNAERIKKGKERSRCISDAQEFLHDNRKMLVKTLKGHFGFGFGSNINVIIKTRRDPKNQRETLSAVAQAVLDRINEGAENSDKELRCATRALKLHLGKATFVENTPEQPKVPEKDLPPCE